MKPPGKPSRSENVRRTSLTSKRSTPYAKIVLHYFPGTELGRRPASKLRVLLVPSAPTLAISSPAPFTVRDSVGQTHQLPAGSITLDPALQVAVDGVPTQLAGPLSFTPTTGSFLSVGPRAYRGSIEISSVT